MPPKKQNAPSSSSKVKDDKVIPTARRFGGIVTDEGVVMIVDLWHEKRWYIF
jgi:hypothetical protein